MKKEKIKTEKETTKKEIAKNKLQEKPMKEEKLLRHVVMFKFNDDTSDQQVEKLNKSFGELPNYISIIKDFEWGLNDSPEDFHQDFTHCYLLTFKSEEDRDSVYTPHPKHQAFVQSLQPHLEKVFVAHTPAEGSDTRPSVVMAEEGGIERRTDGSQWMVLSNGKRYEQAPEELDYSILHFERYRVYLREQEGNQSQRRLWSLPTKQLIGSEDLTQIAELQWRISLPLTIPILTLMVVPLAAVNPRQGRYAKLLPAILLYLSYYLMLSAARSALEEGKIPPEVGLWSVHALMLFISLSYLFIRSEYYLKVRGKVKGKACVSDS